MTVSGIDYDGIGTCLNECRHTVQCIDSNAYTCGHAQTALAVLACHGFVLGLGDILVCDKTYQLTVVVHNRQLLNLILLKYL